MCVDCYRIIRMIFGFVTYVKNRRIGSTYPTINAKPATKALKAEKKIRVYLLAKLVKLVNALPLPRYKDAIIVGNTIELNGTCIDCLILYAKQNEKKACVWQQRLIHAGIAAVAVDYSSGIFCFDFEMIVADIIWKTKY